MNTIDDFKAYYRDFSSCDMNNIDRFYHPDIHFSDPIHQIQGVQNVKEYFSSMCDDLIECRFEFLGETVDERSAWFKWNMFYRHPKLKNGDLLSLTGATYIKFEEYVGEVSSKSANNINENDESGYKQKIISHEDFYDMGSMLYEHTPVLGGCVRWLKQRLVKSEVKPAIAAS